MAVVADCTSSSGVAGGITEAQLKDQFSRLYGSASQSLGPDFTWDNSFSFILRNTSAAITYTIENALCSEAGTKSVRCVNNRVLLDVCQSNDAEITTSVEESSAGSSVIRRLQAAVIAERNLRASQPAEPESPHAQEHSGEVHRAMGRAADGTAAKDIAIVTMIGETSVKAYSEISDYERLAQLTLQSMTEYATRWGHPLFYLHAHMMQQDKQAYWAKIELMEHYLSLGYEYVLYTDVDVLFLQMETPLSTFIVPGKAVISVDECSRRNGTNPLIRSGFMLLRNSPNTLEFLRVWKASYEHYRDIENPEQSALEVLSAMPRWAPLFHLHSWRTFHAYDTCHGYQSAFSVHFPGGNKVARVGRVLAWSALHKPMGAGLDNRRDGGQRQQSLTTLFGGQLSTAQLAAAITKARLDLHNPTVKIYDGPRARVQQCLEANGRAGHIIPPYDGGDSGDDRSLHRQVLEYDVAAYFFPIPSVIYLTVPDPDHLPATVAANVRKWREMNPGFSVVVYGDAQVNALAAEYLDMDPALWRALTPVQRTDIWRYLVVFLFGGWYVDSDVECVRPIAEWGHGPTATLVVGVEAEIVRSPGPSGGWGGRHVVLSQYAFGAAARHPALGATLRSILAQAQTLLQIGSTSITPEERQTLILSTTGPWAWSDAVAAYACYADSYPNDMRDPLNTLEHLAAGGNVVNTHVFSISGFGAGQDHSSSPSASDVSAPINALHHFGGSVAFHGKRWTVIPLEEQAKHEGDM